MVDDYSQCLVSSSRMAARAVTRRYDAYFRPHGLTSAQFSLLATLTLVGDPTVSQLAEARGFERTTLTRNLDRLQQMELIASRPADKGNGRICTITAKGEALIQELLPLWRRAQAEMKSHLTAAGFEDSLRVLKCLAAL